MFYSTKIKTLGSGGAVDENGRWLRFIGRLPVKEGDTVYTDGNVIFGHVPPKGAPLIVPDEPSGIPVLGDSYLLADEEQELRGYFTSSGKYKKYKIAGEDWIVNSEKKFVHGEEYFNRDEVIDADITDDGKKIIVTSGVYKDSYTLDTTNVAFWTKDTRMWGIGIPVYGPYVYEQILGSSAIFSENVPAKLFINDNEQTIDLSLYAKDAEARALSCAEKIMVQSYTGESSYPYVTPEELTQKQIDTTGHINGIYFSDGSIDEAAKTRPAEPFITYSTAYILSSNTDDKGFSGIIFAAAHGFCFPYIESRFFANRIRNYGIRDDKSPDYYLIVGAKAIREWKCVPFGFSCIYKVENNTAMAVAFRDSGGINSTIPAIDAIDGILISTVGGSPDGYTRDVIKWEQLILQSGFMPKDFDNELLPVGEGFYSMNKFGLLTFYDSNQNKIAENIPVHENFYHVEFSHAEFYFNQIRFNDTPDYWNYNVYTTDGKIESKIFSFVDEDFYIVQKDENGNVIGIIDERHDDKDETFPPVDGYYIKYTNGTLEPLHFTPLFYRFKNGSFLFGVKGGKLYLKDKTGEV